MRTLVMDIETRPLPFEEVRHLAPAELLVSTPTIDMIAEKEKEIAADGRITKQATRSSNLEEWIADFPNHAERRIEKWLDDAQLNPTKSVIDAVGVAEIRKDEAVAYNHYDVRNTADEAELLEMLRRDIEDMTVTIVGHNITGFDLGYMSGRATLLRVGPIRWTERGKKWPRSNIVDTKVEWENATAGRAGASMDFLSRAFGLPTKPFPELSSYQDRDGAIYRDSRDFWRWNDEARHTYLKHDVDTTITLARLLGITL